VSISYCSADSAPVCNHPTAGFRVNGTLIEAWASMKSFRPKDGSGEPPAPGRNGARDFHGEKR